MYQLSSIAFFLFVLVSVCVVTLGGGHSFMLEPPPYDIRYVAKDCRSEKNYLGKRGSCDQACPNYPSKRAEHTHRNPIRTYKRGESVLIRWAKNNHHGGFMAVGFVPREEMMDKEAHKKYYTYYGCWEQKRVRCRNNMPCGTDNEVFERRITVPTQMPDGVYVFTWVWFGGLQFMRDHGQFPDYHSCAFVRIKGGAPVDTERGFQPVFESGETGKRAVNGRCHAAIDAPGKCPIDGCEGPKYPREVTVPAVFKNSRKPAQLFSTDFSEVEAPSPTPSPSSSVSESPTASPSALPSESASPAASESPASFAVMPSPSGSAGPTGGPEPMNEDLSANCVWDGRVCCLEKCGKCGGKGCKKLPGGVNNCCKNTIKKSKRVCGRDPPPCTVITSGTRSRAQTFPSNDDQAGVGWWGEFFKNKIFSQLNNIV